MMKCICNGEELYLTSEHKYINKHKIGKKAYATFIKTHKRRSDGTFGRNSLDCEFCGGSPGTEHREGCKLMVCCYCQCDKRLVNPTGFCNHLYYPMNCDICNRRENPTEQDRGIRYVERKDIIDWKKMEKEIIVFQDDYCDCNVPESHAKMIVEIVKKYV
jgi:hypothetical protein